MSMQNISTEAEAIKSENQKFMDTFDRGDAAGMATLYTKTGQLLPTGSDFVTGGSAITRFWQGAMDMGIKFLELYFPRIREASCGSA